MLSEYNRENELQVKNRNQVCRCINEICTREVDNNAELKVH
ncbi:protein of unknown function [Candidatus Nitrosocosmicus franklandus]|uniref:Uncharacterized protein n=1 Tax=Candidatus Nitrosocosmicus franklandianus TaxID=1798806 RepID=A0A484ICR0_9ARCH|nr:protein of unknown function [Candidatus Nitrosocosmicus franklandus]